jgi:ribonuclease PH
VQASAEGAPFSQDQLAGMLALAQRGVADLFALQRATVDGAG